MPSIITKQEEVAGIPVEAVEQKWQSFAHALGRTILCLPQARVLSAQHTQRHGYWITAIPPTGSEVTSATDAIAA